MSTGTAIFILAIVYAARWVGDWSITWLLRWRQERKFQAYRKQQEALAKISSEAAQEFAMDIANGEAGEGALAHPAAPIRVSRDS